MDVIDLDTSRKEWEDFRKDLAYLQQSLNVTMTGILNHAGIVRTTSGKKEALAALSSAQSVLQEYQAIVKQF